MDSLNSFAPLVELALLCGGIGAVTTVGFLLMTRNSPLARNLTEKELPEEKKVPLYPGDNAPSDQRV